MVAGLLVHVIHNEFWKSGDQSMYLSMCRRYWQHSKEVGNQGERSCRGKHGLRWREEVVDKGQGWVRELRRGERSRVTKGAFEEWYSEMAVKAGGELRGQWGSWVKVRVEFKGHGGVCHWRRTVHDKALA